MNHEARAFLRDLAWMVGLPLVVVVAALTSAVPWGAVVERNALAPPRVPPVLAYAPPDGNVFEAAAGRWDWSAGAAGCTEESHVISFSDDRRMMTIEHAKIGDSVPAAPERWTYDILSSDSSRITGKARTDGIRIPAGQPAVWDFVLTGPDVFRLHREEWGPDGYAGEFRRCDHSPPAPAAGRALLP